MTRPIRVGARALASAAATIILLAAIGRAPADTFFVDAANTSGIEDGSPINPFRTIQAGIDGARARNSLLSPLAFVDPNFDTSRFVTIVQVMSGTYVETVVLPSGIKLLGGDPNTTIIDGGGHGPVVTIRPADSNTQLDGFTITGGISFIGGGVFVQGGTPVVSNNIITGNQVVGTATSASRGGGLAIAADATVEGNLVVGNQAIIGSGGGISLTSGSPTISRNTIRGNRALSSAEAYFGYGGGIEVERTVNFPTITTNVIQGNRADAGGGGIDVYRASPSITQNLILGNEALGVGGLPGSGGGINVVGEKRNEEAFTPSIVNNLIMRNRARDGGGVNNARSRPLYAGNDFYDNVPGDAARPRGPLGLDLNIDADPEIDPNTFAPTSTSSPLVDSGSNGLLRVEPGPDRDPNTRTDNRIGRIVLIPPDDFSGSSRPVILSGSGKRYDIGLIEFSPDASNTNDLDGDGIPRDLDGDPNTANPCIPDPNGEFSNCDDNCPLSFNPGQEDGDHDGIGDICDNCPAMPNGGCDPNQPVTMPRCDANMDGMVTPFELAHAFQADIDLDLIGDLCDADRDNDGIPEDSDGDPNTSNPCVGGRRQGCDDNCPELSNSIQRDVDHDGVGDVCDNCPRKRNGFCDPNIPSTVPLCDADHDRKISTQELAASGQADTEHDSNGRKFKDGIGDACDNCLTVPNGTCGLTNFPDACNVDMSVDPNGNGTTTGAEAALGSQRDQDRDHIGDACDPDRDNDGIVQELLSDPNTIQPTCAGGVTMGCNDNCTTRRNPTQSDADSDGVGDLCDNCPVARNGDCSTDPLRCDVNLDGVADPNEIAIGDQANFDHDKQGDACDPDDDNDGVLDDGDGDPNTYTPCDPDPNGAFSNCDDNCQFAFDQSQSNIDHDVMGDVCDSDLDGDGVDEHLISDPNTIRRFIDPNIGWTDPNNVILFLPCAGGATTDCSDNCPRMPNGACDPNQPATLPLCDVNLDSVVDPNEIAAGNQRDSDGDGVGDACDDCPLVADPSQTDTNGDGAGDSCDIDLDRDCVPAHFDPNAPVPSNCLMGLAPADDNCLNMYNPFQEDTDLDPNGVVTPDGVGDACDNCPAVYNPTQTDSDHDGLGDACETSLLCALTPRLGTADSDADRIDDDGDKSGVIGDRPCRGGDHTRCDDNCLCVPNPAQLDLDRDGAGDACDDDLDDDGIPQDLLSDPNDPNSTPLPTCAGGATAGCSDNCPSKPNGVCDPNQPATLSRCDVNLDGVVHSNEMALGNQRDTDGDGVGDACDSCPSNGTALQSDSDGDGPGDACDNCPSVYNPGQADADSNGVGDACEGRTLSLAMETRGDTQGVVAPGGLVKFELLFTNKGVEGVRADFVISLRDPSGNEVLPEKTLSLEGFAGEVSKAKQSVKIPPAARRGTWVVVAEGTVRGSGASLAAGLAVAVK